MVHPDFALLIGIKLNIWGREFEVHSPTYFCQIFGLDVIMRIVAIISFCFFFAAAIYFFSPPAKRMRESIWSELDKDRIILKDKTSFSGWIWTETETAIMGQKKNKKLFTVESSDVGALEHNALFRQLQNIL